MPIYFFLSVHRADLGVSSVCCSCFVGHHTGNASDSNTIPIFSLDNITNGGMDLRESPPKAIVDATPLQAAMDKNKECKYIRQSPIFCIRLVISATITQPITLIHCSSLITFVNCVRAALKVKLMVRRPITQLVEQGIIPCKRRIRWSRDILSGIPINGMHTFRPAIMLAFVCIIFCSIESIACPA